MCSPTQAHGTPPLTELIGDGSGERAQRVMAAMMTMGKLDVAEIEAAAQG